MKKPKTFKNDVPLYVILMIFVTVAFLVSSMMQLVCLLWHGRHDWQVSMFKGEPRTDETRSCSHCGVYEDQACFKPGNSVVAVPFIVVEIMLHALLELIEVRILKRKSRYL